MEIISYTVLWRDKLVEFLINNYPNRNKNYLKWSVMSIEDDVESQKKTFLIISNDKVLGCLLSLPLKLRIDGDDKVYTFGFNIILSSDIRGIGFGKKLYEKKRNDYQDYFCIGLTHKAIIMHKKLNDIFINPIRVYISINVWCIKSMCNKIINKRKRNNQDYIFPNIITIDRVNFEKINSSDELIIPQDGYWLNDKIEFTRDKDFIQKRFFDIYKEYHVYKDLNNTCYFVIRNTYVRGVEMFSLVDYRVRNFQQEKIIYRAAMFVAKMNRVGLLITFSSKNHPFLRFSPLTIRINKKLLVATAITTFKPNEKIFITSADADLDFVYYT